MWAKLQLSSIYKTTKYDVLCNMSCSLLFVWYNHKQYFYKPHAFYDIWNRLCMYLRDKCMLSTTTYGFVSITNTTKNIFHSQHRFKFIIRFIMAVSVTHLNSQFEQLNSSLSPQLCHGTSEYIPEERSCASCHYCPDHTCVCVQTEGMWLGSSLRGLAVFRAAEFIHNLSMISLPALIFWIIFKQLDLACLNAIHICTG